MRFSIRDLLALGLLVALSLLAYQMLVDSHQQRVRLTQLQSEINRLQMKLRTDDPAMNETILATRDEFQSLSAMRQRAEDQFEVLREKYSEMQSRGPGIVSIRRIPTLREDDGPWPAAYRMLIPQDRPVWLKYGVHMQDTSHSKTREPDEESDLVATSPFRDTGPLQLQLPPGDHTLTITTKRLEGKELPIIVRLDEAVVLQTVYSSARACYPGGASTSPTRQFDVPNNSPLPWLLTVRMDPRKDEAGMRPKRTHACSFWLSNQSSDFAPFPVYTESDK